MAIFYWSIIYLLEILKLNLIVVKLMGYEQKREILLFKMGFICVLAIAFIIKTYGLDNSYLTYIVGSIAIIAMTLSLKNNRNILVVILAFLIICVVDVILASLYALLMGYDTDTILNSYILSLVSNSISIIVLYLLVNIKKSIKTNKLYIHKHGINKRYIIIAFLGVLGIALYIAPVQILGLMQHSGKIKLFTVLGISLSGVAFIAICIGLIILNSNNTYYQECLKVNEELLQQQKEYYYMLIKKDNDTKKFRHDITNHIFCMNVLLKDGNFKELHDYMVDMQETIEKLNSNIQTGNDIVNIIAGDILGKRIEKDITLKWKGFIPNKLKVSNMDLCIIFSNLFKNAVEATDKVLGSSEKVIEVNIKKSDTSLMIEIRNSIDKRVNIINNRLVTSKIDKSKHGFGSLNVENVVNKYGGNIEYISTDNSFLVEILLEDIIVSM